jgi:hypothetical protein
MYKKRNNLTWQYLGIIIVVGMIAGFGWWFFSPAFIDNPVNEALPTSAVAESQTTPEAVVSNPTVAPVVEAQPTTQPSTTSTEQILLRGNFYNLVHLSSGEAAVYQLTDGSRILRLQNFSVDNGPDLYVYLVPVDPVPSTSGTEIAGYYSLGSLKGNVGDQNYEIPADLDLSQYKSVVIWCQAFAVPFSAAPLTPQ